MVSLGGIVCSPKCPEIVCFGPSKTKPFANLQYKDGWILLSRRESRCRPGNEQVPISWVPMIVARTEYIQPFDFDMYLHGAAPVPLAVQTFITSAVNTGYPATLRVEDAHGSIAITSGSIRRHASDEKGLWLRRYPVKKGLGLCLLQGSQLQLNWSALQEGSIWKFYSGTHHKPELMKLPDLALSNDKCDLENFDHFVWDHHAVKAQ